MLKTRSETKHSFLLAFSGMSLVVLSIFTFIVFMGVITFLVRFVAVLLGMAA